MSNKETEEYKEATVTAMNEFSKIMEGIDLDIFQTYCLSGILVELQHIRVALEMGAESHSIDDDMLRVLMGRINAKPN